MRRLRSLATAAALIVAAVFGTASAGHHGAHVVVAPGQPAPRVGPSYLYPEPLVGLDTSEGTGTVAGPRAAWAPTCLALVGLDVRVAFAVQRRGRLDDALGLARSKGSWNTSPAS
jgi:hypothetical protein